MRVHPPCLAISTGSTTSERCFRRRKIARVACCSSPPPGSTATWFGRPLIGRTSNSLTWIASTVADEPAGSSAALRAEIAQ